LAGTGPPGIDSDSMENDEVARIARLLESLLSIRKVSVAALGRHLGMSASNLWRIFDGSVELKYRLVIDILKYLDIAPLAFFQIAYESHDATTELLAARLDRLRQAEEPSVERMSKGELRELVKQTLEQLGGLNGLDQRAASPARDGDAPPAPDSTNLPSRTAKKPKGRGPRQPAHNDAQK
jgi:transcriptional regulator with XRE-family HTH domain